MPQERFDWIDIRAEKGLAQAAELAGQLGAGVFPLGEAAQGTFVEAGGHGES